MLWRSSREERLVSRWSKALGWPCAVYTTSPRCRTVLKLDWVRGRAGDRRITLAPACTGHEVGGTWSLDRGEAHVCQVVSRGGSLEDGLRRSVGGEGHARSGCCSHMVGRMRGLKVVLRGRSLHSRRRHRYGADIAADWAKCLRSTCQYAQDILLIGSPLTSRGRRTENRCWSCDIVANLIQCDARASLFNSSSLRDGLLSCGDIDTGYVFVFAVRATRSASTVAQTRRCWGRESPSPGCTRTSGNPTRRGSTCHLQSRIRWRDRSFSRFRQRHTIFDSRRRGAEG